MCLVVFPVHALWHEISEVLTMRLFLVADFSELCMLYLHMVQSSNRISLLESVSSNVPNSSGHLCCHQDQVKGESKSEFVLSVQWTSCIINIVMQVKCETLSQSFAHYSFCLSKVVNKV